jgi:hypothetical protein
MAVGHSRSGGRRYRRFDRIGREKKRRLKERERERPDQGAQESLDGFDGPSLKVLVVLL